MRKNNRNKAIRKIEKSKLAGRYAAIERTFDTMQK